MTNYWPLLGIAAGRHRLRAADEPDAGGHRLGDRHRPAWAAWTRSRSSPPSARRSTTTASSPSSGSCCRSSACSNATACSSAPAALIRGFKNATTGRLLILYLLYRQMTSAIGLQSTAGHPQTVRPLVAPMALAAAEKQQAGSTRTTAERSRPMPPRPTMSACSSARTSSSRSARSSSSSRPSATYGYNLAPLDLAVWAIPTAVGAFLIHSARLLMLDRR